MKKIAFSILCTLSIAGAQAQTIVTDRPNQTESALAVPAGTLQIESGFGLTFSGSGTSQSRQMVAPFSLFRVGLLKDLELRLVSQYESLKFTDTTLRGMSDMQVGGKWAFFNSENSPTQMGLLAHLRVPSGTPGLSTSGTSLETRFLVSHQMGAVGLGSNLAWVAHSGRDSDLLYTLSLAVSLSAKVGVFIEPYGEYTGLEDWQQNFNAGFTYLINPQWQFDMSFGTGLNQEMNFLAFGLSALLGGEV